ncbi:MAG: CBS domain-containing protein [Desulfobacterales bacterium]|nr:CBS domain-containing protein [Desulfobacterales bacterium]
MFSIYNKWGRETYSTLEDLYRVETINPIRRVKRLATERKDEDEISVQSSLTNKALKSYSRLSNIRNEEAIHYANQIMKRPVITVFDTTTVTDCYNLIEEKEISQLPVLNNENKPIGLITKENLLKVLLVDNNTISHAEIESIKPILSQPMITADPESEIRRVAQVMYDQQLNCIPITNNIDVIIGIITRTDIIHAVSTHPVITLWA